MISINGFQDEFLFRHDYMPCFIGLHEIVALLLEYKKHK